MLDVNSNYFEDNTISISNPINENIELSEVILKNYDKMKIFDISGKKLLELNSLTNKIEVSNLNLGMYFVQFFNNVEKSKTIKIIKK